MSSSSYACAVALKGLIESNWASANVGLGTIPATTTLPYIIIHPQETTELGGSMDDSMEWGTHLVLVKSVGATVQQCDAVRMRVFDLALKKRGSDYLYSMTLDDGSKIEWRTMRTHSAIVESGRDLYEANDIYGFRKAF